MHLPSRQVNWLLSQDAGNGGIPEVLGMKLRSISKPVIIII